MPAHLHLAAAPLAAAILSTVAIAQGPTWIRNPLNGREYALTAPATWTDAEATAVGLGGHLATIRDADERDWIRREFGTGENLWIGLNDAAVEGTFAWSSGEPVTFTDWCPGEPNGGVPGRPDEDHVHLAAFPPTCIGGWNDAPNARLYRGIVERAAAWSPFVARGVTRIYGASDAAAWVVRQGDIEVFDGRVLRPTGLNAAAWPTAWLTADRRRLCLFGGTEAAMVFEDGRVVRAPLPFAGTLMRDPSGPVVWTSTITWVPGSDTLGHADVARLLPDGRWATGRRFTRDPVLPGGIGPLGDARGEGAHVVNFEDPLGSVYFDLLAGRWLDGCLTGTCPDPGIANDGTVYYWRENGGDWQIAGITFEGRSVSAPSCNTFNPGECSIRTNPLGQVYVTNTFQFTFGFLSLPGCGSACMGVDWNRENAAPYSLGGRSWIFGARGLFTNGAWNPVPFDATGFLGDDGGRQWWSGAIGGSFQLLETQGGAGFTSIAAGFSRPLAQLTRGRDTWLFVGETTGTGREPWRFDPATGTVALAWDIAPGTAGSNPRDLTAMGGAVLLIADGPLGPSLHRFDAANVETFGSGCPGATATLTLDATTGAPRLGRPFTLRTAGLTPATTGLLFFALDDRSWLSFELPYSLATLGAPGCSVLVDIDPGSGATDQILQADASGTASFTVPIPNDVAALGLRFFNQFVAYEAPPSRPLPLSVSNGTRAVIGF